MTRHRFLWLALWLWPAAALAQTPDDRTMATALFNDGLRLADAGKFDEACPKFEAAKRHLPTFPIQYALAQCWENLGRTADAWQEYRAAATTATRAGDPRGKQALDRAARLEPSVAHLTITLPAADIAGLEVALDGAAIDRALSGVPIPINPGPHVVGASAPGRTPWSATVTATSRNVGVTVPVLAPLSPPVESPPPATRPVPAPGEAPPAVGGGRRTAALLVGGAGVAVLGVGVAIGFIAKSHYDDANRDHCHSMLTCDDQMGADAVNDARHLGNVGTIVGAVGLAAVATGTILYVTAPERPRPALGVAVTRGYVGVNVTGGF